LTFVTVFPWFLKKRTGSSNFPSVNEKEKIAQFSGVVLAPSRHFVFRSFEPVEGITGEESLEAALLAFEEEAPYPVDQLARGVFADASGRVVVWGCDRAVLPPSGGDAFVLPEFFPLIGWERERGAVEILESEQGGALLFFDEGGTLPTDVIGLRAKAAVESSAPEEEDAVPPETESGVGGENEGSGGSPEAALDEQEIQAAFRFLGRNVPGLESIPRLRLIRVSVDSRGRFEALVAVDGSADRTWALSDEPLWAADLRPTEESKRYRAQKTAGERIWLGARIAAGFLIVVALAQVLSWIFGYWVDRKESLLSTQAPLVASVEERANLASRLKDLGESRLSVFERLGDLNLARPEGIQFLDVRFDEPDLFRIEGRVANVRVLNEFVGRLRSDPRFVVTEAPPPRTRDGRVEFGLSVRVPGQEGGRG